MIATVLFGGVLGACIGSFCNVLVIRMKEGKSLGGRSACMACQQQLAARDLVPIVSWFALQGKCRSCHTPIHVQYPIVEALGAVIGAYAVWQGDVVFTAAFLFFLLVITAFDMRWQLVPTMFTAVGAAVFAAWNIFIAHQDPLLVVGGALAAGGFLAVLSWGSRGRLMGEGDPVVGVAIGAALAWPLGLAALLVAFVVGGAIAAVLLMCGIVSRKTPVPFVPFLAAGALIVYAWGEGVSLFLRYAFG